jgi:multidrug resistance efflux pump
MMNTRKLIIINMIVIIIVAAIGIAGYYFYNQSSLYLETDNAQVSGQEISITAPSAGKLVSWSGSVGTKFNSGDPVGQIEVQNGNTTQTIPIPIPQNGTIVQNDATADQYVIPGTPLADAYDMNNLFVTANIDETKIQDVKVGDVVDVYADAFPGITLNGSVKSIGLATASTFSLLPSSSTNANFTKVTQVIPVMIKLNDIPGGLVPGMNVSVRIHK